MNTHKNFYDILMNEEIHATLNLSKIEKSITLNKKTDLIYEVIDEDIHCNIHYDIYDHGLVVSIDAELFDKPLYFAEQNRFLADNSISMNLPMSINTDEFLTISEYKDWWMYPYFISDLKEIPKNTQLLLFKDENSYVAIVTYTSTHFKTDLVGNKQLSVTMTTNREGLTHLKGPMFAMSTHSNPFEAVRLSTEALVSKNLNSIEKLRRNKSYPEMFEYLGWCTWDSFYKEVSSDKIIDKMEEFKKEGFPIHWLLIDDGWHDVNFDNHKLYSLSEDKVKFPEGMQKTIDILKNNYAVKKVGLWHTLSGYWNGLEKDFIGSDHIQLLPDGRIHPKIDDNLEQSFWTDWFSDMNSWGVDFTKVDSQSSLKNFYRNVRPIGESSQFIHRQLNYASEINSMKIIHCMGMSGDQLWGRKNETIVRTSDDFIPQNKESFKKHAIENSYCSILQESFSWCDWDMFWSHHQDASKHAVLRFLSGGPIYISDEVGKTNFDILAPLIGNDGKIFMCDNIGLPTKDNILKDPLKKGNVLKVMNRSKDTTYVGVFEVNESSIIHTIDSKDYELNPNKEFLIYDWNHRKIEVFDKNVLKLDSNDWRLLMIVPKENDHTPLGIIEKYNMRKTFETMDEKIIIKTAGTFTFASEHICYVKVNGQKKSIKSEGVLHFIDDLNMNDMIEITF